MRKYIGTKTVYASPAWRIDGRIYLKDEVRPVSNEKEDGYKVVYDDGYTSWCPKLVFEETYQLAETPGDRVYIEHCNLSDKLQKLDVAVTECKIEENAMVLLKAQQKAMKDYLNILSIRLLDFSNEGTGYLAEYDASISFSVAMSVLEAGGLVRRKGWENKNLYIVKQVPARIEGNVIPRMTSLPEQAKEKLMKDTKFISYESQCLIIDSETGIANSWHPSISDVFSEDWVIVNHKVCQV